MGVSGVGSSYTCMYNASTGKLSSKDGSDDEFASYYNGELSAEETTMLNGYDLKRKHEIDHLFLIDMWGRNIFDSSNENEYEITGKIVDALTSEYYVNGEKVLTVYTGVPYMAEDFEELRLTGPFRAFPHLPYDPVTNSINITVGDVFNLGNGYSLRVMEDRVVAEGPQGGVYNGRANILAVQLEHLLRFVGQQSSFSDLDAGYGDSSMLISLLNELGVDTNREFTINGTKCVIENGSISEVGNRDGMPSTIFNKALKRYEEWLYNPLSSGKFLTA